MMRVALAVPVDDERGLLAAATRHGLRVVAQCSSADELASRVRIVQPELVLATAQPQYLTARVIAACDGAGVRLLVAAATSREVKYARSLGIIDVLEGELSWDRLVPSSGSRVDAVSAPPALAPAPAETVAPTGTGTVIVVWGASGAPGRTSLAIALAAELADAGHRVALADADTHGAAVAPALGLLDEAPGFAAACRLAGTGALDDAQFQRISDWHRSGNTGFWVLTGLGRPSRWPELSAERVTGVMAAARQWCDVLVVDVASSLEQDEELSSDLAAPRRNAATLAALRAADHVVAVGAADPVGLARYLRAHSELLETIEPSRVTTVINKVRSSAIGLNPAAQVTQTLGRFGGVDDPVLVPWDPFAFDAALLSGKSLAEVAPRSAARVAVRRLAHDRLGVSAPSVGRSRTSA